MIALVAASAIFLTAGQAVINGPRNAFQTCLRQASGKAPGEKVSADGFEAYVRTNCAAELGAFRGAVVKFDMGNKMSRKASDEDADAMIQDFMGDAVDSYKYHNGGASPVKEASAPPPKPPATPAASPLPPK